MSANSNSPAGTPPPVRLGGPQESHIQFTLKLKNIVYAVSL